MELQTLSKLQDELKTLCIENQQQSQENRLAFQLYQVADKWKKEFNRIVDKWVHLSAHSITQSLYKCRQTLLSKKPTQVLSEINLCFNLLEKEILVMENPLHKSLQTAQKLYLKPVSLEYPTKVQQKHSPSPVSKSLDRSRSLSRHRSVSNGSRKLQGPTLFTKIKHSRNTQPFAKYDMSSTKTKKKGKNLFEFPHKAHNAMSTASAWGSYKREINNDQIVSTLAKTSTDSFRRNQSSGRLEQELNQKFNALENKMDEKLNVIINQLSAKDLVKFQAKRPIAPELVEEKSAKPQKDQQTKENSILPAQVQQAQLTPRIQISPPSHVSQISQKQIKNNTLIKEQKSCMKSGPKQKSYKNEVVEEIEENLELTSPKSLQKEQAKLQGQNLYFDFVKISKKIKLPITANIKQIFVQLYTRFCAQNGLKMSGEICNESVESQNVANIEAFLIDSLQKMQMTENKCDETKKVKVKEYNQACCRYLKLFLIKYNLLPGTISGTLVELIQTSLGQK